MKKYFHGTRLRALRLHFFILILTFALIGFGAVRAEAAPIVATIFGLHGSGQLRHSGRISNLNTNASLYVGDTVRTGAGGKVTVLFSDGSQVRLNANAAIQITTPTTLGNGKRSLFRVLGGEIWARLRPGRAARTASADLGVAGTEFDVRVSDDETTTLTVLEGIVDFSNPFGAVAVGASQQSTARAGSAPTAPVTVPNPGLIVEWTLDLERAIIPREKFFISLDPKVLQPEIRRRAAGAQRAPDDAAARRDYGDALFDSRRYTEALAEYQGADRLLPRQATTATRIGYALLELNRPDEAEAAFRTALEDAPAEAASAKAEASTGLASAELAQGQPEKAEPAARDALAADGRSAEAAIALGLSLMRQPGKEADARLAFEGALTAEPVDLRYQANSWLALLALAQNDRVGAVQQAQLAVQTAPASGLAHGNLALVYFFSDQPVEAVREGRIAAALNPDSVAASVALGQAYLANGDIDAAARVAARATALDPRLPEAHYLLGIADAARRDYVHAERSLHESLRIAPQFLPAVSALARVYNRMGRTGEAVTLLTNLQAGQTDNGSVAAAFGEVLYEQAQYPQAVAQYRRAIALQPDSALNYAGFARLALDANLLNEAIIAGQNAVRLAPGIGQYHAILGLAYTYSRLDTQAEREFRTALTLDPQNALALVQLAFRNEEGDIRTTRRTAGLAFAQGFLYDPAISHELLRGGVDTELTAQGGNHTGGLTAVHRDVADNGDLHFYGRANYDTDSGNGINDARREFNARGDATLVSGPRTNLYLHALHQRDGAGIEGPAANPDPADHEKFGLSEGIIAGRYRLGVRGHLYAGLFANDQNDSRTNPDKNLSYVLSNATLFGAPIQVLDSSQNSDARNPELRLDLNLGNSPQRPRILTLGAAQLRTNGDFSRSLFVPALGGAADNTGILRTNSRTRTNLAYAQLAQQSGKKLSFSVQLRVQDVNNSGTQTFTNTRPGGGGLGLVTFTPALLPSKTYVLPSTIVNYQANPRTALRLFASRRLTDVTSSILAPSETLLSTEGQVLPTGLPETSDVLQLDLEHRLPGNALFKLFLFHTDARNVRYDASSFLNSNDAAGVGIISDSSINLGRLKRNGAGARYERQLGRSLFAQAGVVYNSTTSRGVAQPQFNGGIAPYQPRIVASSGLNYVDARGYKAGVTVNYTGAFFLDNNTPVPGARPRFPGKTTFDLLFARERTVRREVFLQVTNVFNTPQTAFQNIPIGQRRIRLGISERF